MQNIVRRTTLIVRDMARSAAWYEEVVGMTRFYDDEVVLSGVGLAAGKAGDRLHLVIMRCEHPDIGMIVELRGGLAHVGYTSAAGQAVGLRWLGTGFLVDRRCTVVTAKHILQGLPDRGLFGARRVPQRTRNRSDRRFPRSRDHPPGPVTLP